MSALNDIAVWIDAVIVFTVLEGLVLLAWHRTTGRGVAPRDFAINMLSGLCLMGALRCLAGGLPPVWTAAWLLAAGLAHGADLLLRLQRTGSPRTPHAAALHGTTRNLT